MVSPSKLAIAGSLLLTSAVSFPLPAGMGFFNLNVFKQLFHWEAEGLCSLSYPVGWTQCRATSDNATWIAMTYNPYESQNFYIWSGDDTLTAQCLISQHYVRDARCISVKGSECEDIAGESKIMNSKSVTVRKLDARTTGVLQEAADSMKGQTMSGAGNYSEGLPGRSGVHMVRVDQERRDVEGISDVYERYYGDVSFFFEGDVDAECEEEE